MHLEQVLLIREQLIEWLLAKHELVIWTSVVGSGDSQKKQTVIRFNKIRSAVGFKFYDSETGKEIKRMFTINTGKSRVLKVTPVDANGNAAPVDGVPVWTVSPEGGATLTVSDDGFTCTVKNIAPLKGQVITVKGDADLGTGVTEITGSEDFETLSAQAASFKLEVGPEVD